MAAAKMGTCWAFLWVLVLCTCGVSGKVCDSSEVPELKIDEAHLTVLVAVDKTLSEVTLQLQSSECFRCDLQNVATIKASTNCTVLVNTRWPVELDILPTNTSNFTLCQNCSQTYQFLEGGEYSLYVTNTKSGCACGNIILSNDPMDSNIPIYVAIAIFIGLACLWILVRYLLRKGICHRILFFWSTEGMMMDQYSVQDLGTPTNINPSDDSATSQQPKAPKKERLKSLDTFRGISILIMIFVNYRGGYYWFFRHSKWNGLTVADLVFPWFIWIMGTAMAYSFLAQMKKAVPKRVIFFKIVKRSIILFLLGLLINSAGYTDGVPLEQLRIPGVLQRFAITYLVTASIHLLCAKSADDNQHRWWAPVRDVLDYWPEWIINLILISLHIGITFGLDVPNCPKGYLGPGGLSDRGKHYNCTGGAAGYIDRIVFGDQRIYNTPTCKEIYKTEVPYDPEGLLGCLTSCFMCFLGLQAGKILIMFKDWVQRVKRMIIWGIFLGTIAAILCKASKNDGWVPINKNLWSVSFVLCLASFAFFLLAFCYLTIDVYKVWSGAPFFFPGMNSIVLYVGHELMSGRAPVNIHLPITHSYQLAINLWGTFFWFLVSAYLYHKKVFITV